MRKFLIALVLPVVLVTGCETKILDARGQNDVCEIHHMTMQSTEIDMPKNATQPAREYLEARVKYFVHSYPRQLPYQPHTRYVVFICDYCVQAEQQWLQVHPQNQR